MKRKPAISFNNFMDFQDRSGNWVKSIEISTDTNRVLYRTRAYCVWMGITSRHSKSKRGFVSNSYRNVTIGFKDFQEFAEWCQTQDNYWSKDESGKFWQIDKDLFSEGKGAGVYSPTTCVFIPAALNSMLPKSPGKRKGDYAQGVSWHIRDKKFRAASSKNSKIVNLGSFETEMGAHRAWQKHKIGVLSEAIHSGLYSDKVNKALTKIRDEIDKDYSMGKETVMGGGKNEDYLLGM